MMVSNLSRIAIGLVATCIISLVSCGPVKIFDDTLVVPESGWTYADTLVYDFDVRDTMLTHNMMLTIKHVTDFAYANVYVDITTTFPDSPPITQQVSLDLADKAGQWLGECGKATCMTPVLISEGKRFRTPGNYKISIVQASRQDTLAGIYAVQLQVYPEGE